jgi:hypothetical protein
MTTRPFIQGKHPLSIRYSYMIVLLIPSLCSILSIVLTTITTLFIITTSLPHHQHRSGSLPFNGPGLFNHQTIPHMCLDNTAPYGALPPLSNPHQNQLDRIKQCT